MSRTEHPDSYLAALADMPVDDLVAALSATEVLQVLGITKEDLLLARSDSNLLDTLRIAYEFINVLRESGVLEIFTQLPKGDQADFLRWVAMTADQALRVSRTKIFASALEQSPLAGGTIPIPARIPGEAH